MRERAPTCQGTFDVAVKDRRRHSRARRNALKAGLIFCTLLLLWLLTLSMLIVAAGRPSPTRKSDVAIVLGAAAYDARPSPVFEERIRHAIRLHRSGVVRKLLFTGGYGPGARYAESSVGRRYAINHGVRAADTLIETASRTTHGNLTEARRMMRRNRLRTALIVSDPLHLKRALRMADDLGLEAVGAPTPTSRFRTWRTKGAFLLRELYFYHHYLVTGR